MLGQGFLVVCLFLSVLVVLQVSAVVVPTKQLEDENTLLPHSIPLSRSKRAPILPFLPFIIDALSGDSEEQMPDPPKPKENICDNPESYRITNVVYDEEAYNKNPTNREDPVHTESSCKNCNDGETTCEKVLKVSKTESKTWSFTNSLKLGVGAEITAGIPTIAEGTLRMDVEVTTSTEEGTSKSVTKEVTEKCSAPLKGHTKIICQMNSHRSKISVPYTADVYCMKDGKKEFKGRMEGVFHGVTFVKGETKILPEIKLNKNCEEEDRLEALKKVVATLSLDEKAEKKRAELLQRRRERKRKPTK